MGYDFYAADTKFFLSHDKQDEALQRLHDKREANGGPVDTVTLADELQVWGFDCTTDAMNNITGIFPSDSKMASEGHYKELFMRLAPFVRDGSFLMYFGEDGALWGWRFQLNKTTNEMAVSVGGVYCVFEEDLTEEQKKFYVEESEGDANG